MTGTCDMPAKETAAASPNSSIKASAFCIRQFYTKNSIPPSPLRSRGFAAREPAGFCPGRAEQGDTGSRWQQVRRQQTRDRPGTTRTVPTIEEETLFQAE